MLHYVGLPFVDLDSFNDAKFKRIHSYIKDHLSRDSCPLCSGKINTTKDLFVDVIQYHTFFNVHVTSSFYCQTIIIKNINEDGKF